MLSVLFNAPSALIGAILGMLFGGLVVENGTNHTLAKEQATHANQLITQCEAVIPRNHRCKLTAEVVK